MLGTNSWGSQTHVYTRLKTIIKFGIVGAGLMGKEMFHASKRISNIRKVNFLCECIGVCDIDERRRDYFNELSIPAFDKLDDLLELKPDFIYCAVPHNLHQDVYCKIIESNIPLLGEKPFGYNLEQCIAINNKSKEHENVLVRCSSEWLFYPGANFVLNKLLSNKEDLLRLELSFLQSLYLNDNLNHWKYTEKVGDKGVITELGLHVLFPIVRLGFDCNNVESFNYTKNDTILQTTIIIKEKIPIIVNISQICAGESNTWSIKTVGVKKSYEFFTENCKIVIERDSSTNIKSIINVGLDSAYKTYSGRIFEFGFNDSIVQMLCSFCDELLNNKSNFGCMTPDEALKCHRIIDKC